MKHLISVVLFILSLASFSQDRPKGRFIEHLMNREYHSEVIYLIDKASLQDLNQSFQDSLNYMKGWSLYSIKKLDRSAEVLQKVTPSSEFYTKARFFAGYNLMHLGKYDQSNKTFNSINTNNQTHQSLLYFEKAGLALMQRDYEGFRENFQKVDTSYYAIAEESKKLNQYAFDLSHHNRKSPLLASIMSAIIPGSGKIYAGKTGEGISSLLTAGGLGFVTWENYNKKGLKNFKTIFFGALFTTFYIGNIYGTVFSVKIGEQEFQNEYDHKILFNLHVPLRNVFN